MTKLQKLVDNFEDAISLPIALKKPRRQAQINHDKATQNVRIKKPTYEKLKYYKDDAGLSYDEAINGFLEDVK